MKECVLDSRTHVNVVILHIFYIFEYRMWKTNHVVATLQYFEHVEEAEWAVQVLKASGKPVAANMCIGPDGDMHGVSTGECAVRLVKAGVYILLAVLCSLVV